MGEPAAAPSALPAQVLASMVALQQSLTRPLPPGDEHDAAMRSLVVQCVHDLQSAVKTVAQWVVVWADPHAAGASGGGGVETLADVAVVTEAEWSLLATVSGIPHLRTASRRWAPLPPPVKPLRWLATSLRDGRSGRVLAMLQALLATQPSPRRRRLARVSEAFWATVLWAHPVGLCPATWVGGTDLLVATWWARRRAWWARRRPGGGAAADDADVDPYAALLRQGAAMLVRTCVQPDGSREDLTEAVWRRLDQEPWAAQAQAPVASWSIWSQFFWEFLAGAWLHGVVQADQVCMRLQHLEQFQATHGTRCVQALQRWPPAMQYRFLVTWRQAAPPHRVAMEYLRFYQATWMWLRRLSGSWARQVPFYHAPIPAEVFQYDDAAHRPPSARRARGAVPATVSAASAAPCQDCLQVGVFNLILFCAPIQRLLHDPRYSDGVQSQQFLGLHTFDQQHVPAFACGIPALLAAAMRPLSLAAVEAALQALEPLDRRRQVVTEPPLAVVARRLADLPQWCPGQPAPGGQAGCWTDPAWVWRVLMWTGLHPGCFATGVTDVAAILQAQVARHVLRCQARNVATHQFMTEPSPTSVFPFLLVLSTTPPAVVPRLKVPARVHHVIDDSQGHRWVFEFALAAATMCLTTTSSAAAAVVATHHVACLLDHHGQGFVIPSWPGASTAHATYRCDWFAARRHAFTVPGWQETGLWPWYVLTHVSVTGERGGETAAWQLLPSPPAGGVGHASE